jgi:hypothetical protein
MNQPEHFEIEEGLAVLRPTGCMPLQQVVRLVTSAIGFARQLGIQNLLVVTSGLTDLHPPNVLTRYLMVHEWASAAGGAMRMVVVCQRELIDPERFGVTVGANAGLVGNVFETEAEARAWLC